MAADDLVMQGARASAAMVLSSIDLVLQEYLSLIASPMSLWLLWWPPTGSSMFMVVVMLLMYSVFHWLYSVGNKITTTWAYEQEEWGVLFFMHKPENYVTKFGFIHVNWCMSK